MEYTIGSLADFISGKNTPNKPKVIKKKLPQPKFEANKEQVENQMVKVKKPTNNAEEASFSRGNKVANKFPFNNKKIKSKKHFSEKPSFDKNNKAPFKKGNKKNKKGNKSVSSEGDDVTVIDHKLIEKLEKGELEENPADCDADDDDKSEENDIQSDSSEDVDDKEVTHKENPDLKKEQDSRTIFVGNIATTVTKSQLLKLFGKIGKVEAVRLRCVTPSNPGVSKRVAVIKKMFHPKRTTMHSYIRFQNREDALKALELNGTKYKEHHLRVQLCDDLEKPDTSKAIFVGNLPFDVEDDDLWAAFEELGTIKSVRVIRNAGTGMGIGIGYVNFESSDSVEFALQMEDVTIKNKVVRIQRCKEKAKKARKARRQERRKYVESSEGQENPKPKNVGNKEAFNRRINAKNKLKNNEQKEISKKVDGVGKPKWLNNKFMDKKSSGVNIKNGVFQGSKSDKKKQKPKVNKGFIQKLKLSQKIAPRTTL